MSHHANLSACEKDSASNERGLIFTFPGLGEFGVYGAGPEERAQFFNALRWWLFACIGVSGLITGVVLGTAIVFSLLDFYGRSRTEEYTKAIAAAEAEIERSRNETAELRAMISGGEFRELASQIRQEISADQGEMLTGDLNAISKLVRENALAELERDLGKTLQNSTSNAYPRGIKSVRLIGNNSWGTDKHVETWIKAHAESVKIHAVIPNQDVWLVLYEDL